MRSSTVGPRVRLRGVESWRATFVRAAVLLAAGLLATGCVFGASAPPSHADAARGIVVDRTGQKSALAGALGARATNDAPPRYIPPGQRWVRGYFHWNGSAYVWVPGQLEPSAAPFARR